MCKTKQLNTRNKILIIPEEIISAKQTRLSGIIFWHPCNESWLWAEQEYEQSGENSNAIGTNHENKRNKIDHAEWRLNMW